MSALVPDLPPDSGLAGVAHRLRMAAALPDVRGRTGGTARAVATALRDVAFGRIPAEERAWIDRIEANGKRVAAGLEIPVAVRWMSLPPVWGRFLTRLVRELAPRSALELGTGFGLSTSYQVAAMELNDSGSMISFDVEDMLAIAGPGLARIELDHRVELVGGDIEETLAEALEGVDPIDYAFVDHDHTEAGTIAAFERLLPSLADGATVVFDDIEWTEEMRRAWGAIEAHRDVAATIGLRRLGIAEIAGRGDAG